MAEFDFWRKWGLELDDAQFAGAFTALGVLAAAPPYTHSGADTAPLREQCEHALRSALHYPLAVPSRGRAAVQWRFPVPKRTVRLTTRRVRLSDLDPQCVAQAWQSIVADYRLAQLADNLVASATSEEQRRYEIANRRYLGRTRLEITGYPVAEPVRPWFRLLLEAIPSGMSAYIDIGGGQGQPCLEWPLRLGFLSGGVDEESVRSARGKWPSRELACTVRVDRGSANCDVLLFTGSSGQLLRRLLEIPVPQKANLLVVRGSFEDDPATTGSRLSAIAAECHASGIVFVAPGVADEAFAEAVNRFVAKLSHNYPVDLAISEAFTQDQPTDPVVFLTKGLVTFQISKVLDVVHSRLMDLPDVELAGPAKGNGGGSDPYGLRPDFARMNMPVDYGLDLTTPRGIARTLTANRDRIAFDHESHGAFSIAAVSRAVDHAEGEASREPRFLQEQVQVKRGRAFVDERRAFLQDVPMLVRFRIGPLDELWTSGPMSFNIEGLPKDHREWRLTVVLAEPQHLKEPLQSTIKLRRTGPSTECEFGIVLRRKTVTESPVFEGRVAVLHRGRVLQTAVLRGRIATSEQEILTDDTIALEDRLPVRARVDDLDARREFDLSLILNHTADDRPRLLAISGRHAWVNKDMNYGAMAADINAVLSQIADREKDYRGPLDSSANQAILVELARAGRALHDVIVTDQLEARTNRPDVGEAECIQVISTSGEALVPLEFIYDYEAPKKEATLCQSWPRMFGRDSCREHCQTNKRDFVCPLGFWGVSKIVERHAVTPEFATEGRELFLQSEARSGRDTLPLAGVAIVAVSSKVNALDIKPLLVACQERLGSAPQEAENWEQLPSLIAKLSPHLLLLLPHTDGAGLNASMEIGSEPVESVDITEAHVCRPGSDVHPLVALLGCDTVGTALEYGSHVASFRRRGAAIVIGTIATVFGAHAANVAAMLVEGMSSVTEEPEYLGDVIRAVKRQALLKGSLMPLCMVAFGDADWKLSTKEP
jgi:hypothetical protein